MQWTGSMALMSRTFRVAYSSLELAQALPQNMLSSHSVALTQNSSRMSKTENGPFSGLSLLESPPQSVLPLEARLVFKIHTKAHGPCCHPKKCWCPGFMWMVTVCASKAMVMSMANIAVRGQVEVCGPAMVRGHIDVHGQCCHARSHVYSFQGPWWCSWSMLQPESMWMSILCVPTGGHGHDFRGHVITWGHVDVHSPCRHHGSHSRIWSVLLPEAVLLSMVHATTEGGVDVRGVSWHLKVCWRCPGVVLPPGTMLTCVAWAAALDHVDVCRCAIARTHMEVHGPLCCSL